MREAGEISAQTCSYYVTACKSFTKWAVREGLAITDPLACLSKPVEKAVRQDLRRVRRVITPEEARKLLAATASGPERAGLTGPERALLYRLAFETGLRRGELLALTAGDFDLDADPPRLWLGGGRTKSGKDADIPLRDGTAGMLREHLRNKLPVAKVFDVQSKDNLTDAFQADLSDAGIPYRDESGRYFDIHAMRHCTATWLADAGVHPKTVQDIMRHSGLDVTLRYFKRTVLRKRAEALASFPSLTVEPTSAIREGTGNAPVATDAIRPDTHVVGMAQGEAQGRSDKDATYCQANKLGQNASGFPSRRSWVRNPSPAPVCVPEFRQNLNGSCWGSSAS
ncbi:MAG: site-specific integrase [Planctomycetota bacterium]|nr:site-specific integrase [Planctomycetota bacterium]